MSARTLDSSERQARGALARGGAGRGGDERREGECRSSGGGSLRDGHLRIRIGRSIPMLIDRKEDSPLRRISTAYPPCGRTRNHKALLRT